MIKRLITNYKMYRKTFRELSSLTDRELADIGINRVDIHAISKDSVRLNQEEVS